MEEKSPTISELAKALVRFQGDMKTIGFDASNPFFKSKYATLANLVEMSRGLLSKNGLAISQLCGDEGSVTTILMHISGEYISGKLTLKPVKDDPQGRGSCLTYARRYSLASILNLVSDDDDDGNHASMPQIRKENHIITPPEGAQSMIFHVEKLAKEKFNNPDEFKAWRIDNGFAESLEGLDQLKLSIIWNKMKTVTKKGA